MSKLTRRQFLKRGTVTVIGVGLAPKTLLEEPSEPTWKTLPEKQLAHPQATWGPIPDDMAFTTQSFDMVDVTTFDDPYVKRMRT